VPEPAGDEGRHARRHREEDRMTTTQAPGPDLVAMASEYLETIAVRS
jgi:hypothetical protein